MGGAERSLLAIVAALDRSHFRACAALGSDGDLAEGLRSLHMPVAVIPMAPIARTRNPLRLLKAAIQLRTSARRIVRFAEQQNVALLYANKNTVIFPTLAAARRLARPSLWHVRNRAARFGWIGSWVVRHYSKLLFMSEALREPFDRAFPQLRHKFATLHEGIPLEPFAELDLSARRRIRTELGVPLDAPLIGMIGRITPWKGQAEFVEAAAIVLKDCPDAYFLVVGDCISSPAEALADARYRDQVQAQRDALGLHDRVIFSGHREDVPALLAAMDVFVLPSIEEPYGLVLLEAMAAGVPTVATSAGGVPEIAEDHVHALLVLAGRPDELARGVIELLRAPDAARTMAKRAEAHVKDQLSHRAFMEKLQDILEALTIDS